MRGCSLRRATLLGLAVLALAGCGDDTGPTGRVARVAVLPEHPSVAVGQTLQMTATAYDTAGDPLSNTVALWRTGDAMRATVSSSGLVTGVTVGSTSVSATIEGVEGSTDLEVTQPTPPVALVTVEPGELKVAPGRQGRLVAILNDNFGTPFTGPAVTWSSANAGIATVDGRGVVTAVARGTTVITATAEGLSATSDVSVDPIFEIVSLAISPTSADIAVRDSAQFAVIAKNTQGERLAGRLVEWSMVTPGFATVSEGGLVVGVSPGQTAVRAAADGFTAEAPVTVLPPLISSTTRRRGPVVSAYDVVVYAIPVRRIRARHEF